MCYNLFKRKSKICRHNIEECWRELKLKSMSSFFALKKYVYTHIPASVRKEFLNNSYYIYPGVDMSYHEKPKCWSLNCVRLFVTPWIVPYQAPLSMEFSRQEYWSGLPFPSPGGPSRSRDWTQVSCIAGRFFTDWATKGTLSHGKNSELPWKVLIFLGCFFMLVCSLKKNEDILFLQ